MQPRFPGVLPPVWNLARRNPAFTGRDGMLNRLHDTLCAILRDTDPRSHAHRTAVAELLVAARPEPRNHRRWAELLPHILACEPATTDDDGLRRMTLDAIRALFGGRSEANLDLVRELHGAWVKRHGRDDLVAIDAATLLADIHRDLELRVLDDDSLARLRRFRGADHLDTVRSAGYLAIDLYKLGYYEKARFLDEDSLPRFQRTLGDDHPSSLTILTNLANDYFTLGLYERARALHEEALASWRRIHGDRHVETLDNAWFLAGDLLELGHHDEAVSLYWDTFRVLCIVDGLAGYRTGAAQSMLVGILRRLGRHDEAEKLRSRFLGPGLI
ncbi:MULTISPECIES: tetratricopeptide repeat protein [Micromonospora]|uniref:Tetratricopeptide repeat protein n=1 Tax=Micromonospora sicca TaxID=2202420 RepID=A0A317DFD6_9ACTN|nr:MULTISPECIES: tetratricopeptide repeat protein [unclassified Micromonospora]MBM0226116.1 tetratricopeptide repeat protein [Micromonospora sp. ATA51]PWR12900.1 hypothetical protein DKT69_22500 [Micromonospora sp. 4G51]